MGCLFRLLLFPIKIFFPKSVAHQAITQATALLDEFRKYKVSLRRRLIRYLFDLMRGRK